MKTKILVIGVVKKGNSILMRKKPKGSPPYKQTWYLFGGELKPNKTVEKTIIDELKSKTGIVIKKIKRISWDTEVKKDLDGKEKLFIYLDTISNYDRGALKIKDKLIEELKWVPIKDLGKYDIVPPSRKVFRNLGFIKWKFYI